MGVSREFLESLRRGLGSAGTHKWTDVDLKGSGKAAEEAAPLVGMEALVGRQVTPDSPSHAIQPYIDSGWLPNNPTTEDIQALSQHLYDYKVDGADPRRGALPPDPSRIPSGVHPQAAHRNAQDIGATIAERQGQPSTGTPEEMDKYARMTTVGGGSPDPAMNQPKPEPTEAQPEQLPDQPVDVPQQGRGGQLAQGAGAGGQGGGYAQAHEVAMADPERQAQLQQAYADEAGAVLRRGDILSNAQNVGADEQQKAAEQYDADMEQVQANQKSRQDYLDRLGDDIEKNAGDLSSQKIDPEHWWHTRSTGQQILGVIAMALGGFAAASRGGQNTAAAMIESAIQNDISAQKSNLENKWSGLRQKHSLLADKTALYGSADVAERQIMAASLQGAAMMANAAVARASSPVEKANAQILASQLEAKAVEAGIQLNKWVQAYSGVGASSGLTKDVKPDQIVELADGTMVAANSSDEAKEFRQSLSAAHEMSSDAKELVGMLREAPKLMLSDPKAYYLMRQRIQAVATGLAQQDIKSLGSGSRGGYGYVKMILEKQGSIGSVLPWKQQQAIEAIDSIAKGGERKEQDIVRQLHGNPIVERVSDPQTQKSGLRINGTFNAGLDNSRKPATAGPKSLKLVGQ